MKLHWQILIALVAGAFAGVVVPGISTCVSWAGKLFMNALSMLVVPIIFFSIVTSVAGISESGLKRIGLKVIACYLLTMLIAALTGLLLVNMIKPGTAVGIESAAIIPDRIINGTVSLKDTIVGYMPENILHAFTQNNTIPVILIAFSTGLLLPKISPEGKKVLDAFFRGGMELTMKMTEIIIKCSPAGVFAIVAGQFAGAPDFVALIQVILLYFLTVTAGLFIQFFVWLPLLMRYGFRLNPCKHLKNMSVPLLTAFSTASSAATIPLTMRAVEHKDGVSRRITDFTIPLGATINMNGTALLECVAVIFIAQAYSIELSVWQQITVVFVSLACAIGSAGIPMSALVMMAIILNVAGLPLEGIGLVIGVDRLLDMMRTALNVYGDTCVAAIVAKSEGESLLIDTI
ncbi:MAG: dicarboxylate/amino acid:cation symporter [Dysgonamonadaceae bacterium]|jgi:Na+/H+-dicarboxylate symporter|nr:dicarboxylate/amino acid:cation symporter [Dysgonamonadaceae bacterium]